MKKAFEHVDKLIIAVGSVTTHDSDNPFSFDVRRKMLEEVIKQENWGDRVIRVIGLKDYLIDDDVWFERTSKSVGKFDVVVSNNEWVNGIFERHSIAVLREGYYKRYMLEGQKIRKLMREKKGWEDRVPKYLISNIKNIK